MSFSDADRQLMAAALEESRVAASNEEVPVGAVVVQGGEIIGRGYNRPLRDCDPTAHAEIVALRDAARQVKNYRLSGASLYVTLEPCAMCVGAMIHARIGRLVFGAYDEKSGAAGTVIDLCDNRKLNHRMEVNGGLLQEQCAGMLQTFFARRRGGS